MLIGLQIINVVISSVVNADVAMTLLLWLTRQATNHPSLHRVTVAMMLLYLKPYQMVRTTLTLIWSGAWRAHNAPTVPPTSEKPTGLSASVNGEWSSPTLTTMISSESTASGKSSQDMTEENSIPCLFSPTLDGFAPQSADTIAPNYSTRKTAAKSSGRLMMKSLDSLMAESAIL